MSQSVYGVEIPAGPVELEGILSVPARARGIVLFAHGTGSGRFSPRNQHVAEIIQQAGIATLLLDLLTGPEARDPQHVFDVALLAERLQTATTWTRTNDKTRGHAVGYFGASTGAGAALVAAATRPGSARPLGTALTAIFRFARVGRRPQPAACLVARPRAVSQPCANPQNYFQVQRLLVGQTVDVQIQEVAKKSGKPKRARLAR